MLTYKGLFTLAQMKYYDAQRKMQGRILRGLKIKTSKSLTDFVYSSRRTIVTY